MAAAVLLAGSLRIFLPTQLRLDDARPVFLVVLTVLIIALIAGDPGRIDRQATWGGDDLTGRRHPRGRPGGEHPALEPGRGQLPT